MLEEERDNIACFGCLVGSLERIVDNPALKELWPYAMQLDHDTPSVKDIMGCWMRICERLKNKVMWLFADVE